MATMLHISAECNRKAAIIESIRAESSPAEIIRFFGYPISAVHDVVTRYNASEDSEDGAAKLAKETHSRERTSRATTVVVEEGTALILEDAVNL